MRLLCDPERKGYPFPVNPNPNPPILFSCLDPVRAKHSITLSVERVMPNVPVLPTPTRAHHIDGSERALSLPQGDVATHAITGLLCMMWVLRVKALKLEFIRVAL